MKDYSPLAQLLYESNYERKEHREPICIFLTRQFRGLPTDYIDCLFERPLVFCLKSFLDFAAIGQEQSSFLVQVLNKFYTQSEDDAGKATKILATLSRLTSFDSIKDYVGLLGAGFGVKFCTFLETV